MSKTHSLLDTYTKVLSQAEHTQNLLLDGSWEPQRVSRVSTEITSHSSKVGGTESKLIPITLNLSGRR
jgi:hypothetical protein